MSATYELARCIVCGSADAREIASAEDIRREIEERWAYHDTRLEPDTPPAHLLDRVAFSQRAPLRVVRCISCGLVYRNPVERSREMEALYAHDNPTREMMQSLHAAQREACRAQAMRLARIAKEHGSGLEVGSYVGAFLAAAREYGWSFTGIDVNRCTNDFSRSLGFDVHDGTIETFDADRHVDAVVIWNCIDQLADPTATLRAARARLKIGGLVALRAPNGACYAAVRPLLGTAAARVARAWLAQNNLLGFPYRFGFTPRSAARLVERLGFEVVYVMGDVLVPIADQWTRRWAALEERAMKTVGGRLARLSRGDRPIAPWFELYARAVSSSFSEAAAHGVQPT